MYRDFFQFQGPVFYHLVALLFGATGPSIAAARAMMILVNAVAATLIALLAARFAGKVGGVVAAMVFACLLVPLWPLAYPQWLAAALLMGVAGLALLFSRKVTKNAEKRAA